MRSLIVGVDSGTQSTKALVIDARDGKVIASAAQEYGLIPGLPAGRAPGPGFLKQNSDLPGKRFSRTLN